jgi:hypothetical protein
MLRTIVLSLVIVLVLGGLLPPRHADALVVLDNFSSLQEGIGPPVPNPDWSLKVNFKLPGDVGYTFTSAKVRLSCIVQNPSIPAPCDGTLSIGTSFLSQTKTFSISPNTTQTMVIDFNMPVGPSADAFVKLSITNTGMTLVWFYATNAPAGFMTYTNSEKCQPSCVAMTEHLGLTLDAEPIIPQPTLLTPAHKAHTTDTTPTFTWSDSGISSIQSARIYIYNDDFSYLFKKVVSGESFTLGALNQLPAVQKYQWRVRYRHQPTNSYGLWSTRNTLFVD